VAFTHEFLKQKPDFSKDETFQVDRSKAPWCAGTAELDALWRLRIKNQLISYSLGDKMQAQKDAEAKKKAKKDPAAAKKLAARLPVKPPQERVGLFYDRLLTSLQENEKMDILELFLNAVTQTYDPHSDYMAPESEEEFDMLMKLSLKGIGAVLQSEEGYVKVSEVMPGGPAALDGRIHDGDWIVAVGPEGGELVDIINMPLRKVVRMIRGEKGTKVQLGIIGGGKSLGGVPEVIVLTRDEIKLTEQEAKSEYQEIPGATGADG
jgi:carboxyl-terminal processing protease